MTVNKKLAAAALAGLLTAGLVTQAVAQSDATTASSPAKEKHACKGQNSCKGQGKDGKNSCKGQGSCATDGSM